MTYKGLDVLILRPDREESAEERFDREQIIMDPGTGLIAVAQRSAAPAPVRPMKVVCYSRYEVTLIRAFLDARRGRDTPFWVPSYQQDLALAADLANGATSLIVLWSGYTAEMFPLSLARRHLALYDPTLNFSLHQVTAASDPGTRTTETLTITPAAGRAFPASKTIVSFLKLVRLEDDYVEIEWHGGQTAIVSLPIREVPNEVPA